MVPRRLVIRPINRIQGQMVKFSKSGNLDRLVRTGDEIEVLSTVFRDMAKDIDEKHYATPECTSSAKHILRTLLDN